MPDVRVGEVGRLQVEIPLQRRQVGVSEQAGDLRQPCSAAMQASAHRCGETHAVRRGAPRPAGRVVAQRMRSPVSVSRYACVRDSRRADPRTHPRPLREVSRQRPPCAFADARYPVLVALPAAHQHRPRPHVDVADVQPDKLRRPAAGIQQTEDR